MTSKGTISHWVEEGNKHSIDINCIEQDKTKIFDMLEKLDLPTPKRYYFEKKDLGSNSIDNLFDGNMTFYCRLLHKYSNKRYSGLVIDSVKSLEMFCNTYKLNDYIINLVERKNISHNGSIMASEYGVGIPGLTVIELLHGNESGLDLFHSRITPVHAEVDELRSLKYSGPNKPSYEDKLIIKKALDLVGGRKHPFPGYYEWEVSNKRIIFRNYQKPKTAYCN